MLRGKLYCIHQGGGRFQQGNSIVAGLALLHWNSAAADLANRIDAPSSALQRFGHPSKRNPIPGRCPEEADLKTTVLCQCGMKELSPEWVGQVSIHLGRCPGRERAAHS